MATNNFLYKSLVELKALAETYKTIVIPAVESRRRPVYTIDDISKEEFDNISNFLINSVIKDAKKIESNESSFSRAFSKYLKKYFEEKLEVDDVIALRQLVKEYNGISFNYLYSNIYKYVYNAEVFSRSVDTTGFLGKSIKEITDKINYFVERTNPNVLNSVKYWMTGINDTINAENMVTGQTYKITSLGTGVNWTSIGATSATVGVIFEKNSTAATGTGGVVATGPFLSASEFYDRYFLKSGVLEASVVLSIISYLNEQEIMPGDKYYNLDTSKLITATRVGTWINSLEVSVPKETNISGMTISVGSKYYDTETETLYTAVSANTWTGATKERVLLSNEKGFFLFNSSYPVERNLEDVFRNEQYANSKNLFSLLKNEFKDYTFSSEIAYSRDFTEIIDSTTTKKTTFIDIKDHYGKIIFSLPLRFFINNQIRETFNFVSYYKEETKSVSFGDLLFNLLSNTYTFLGQIINFSSTNIDYQSNISFFYNSGIPSISQHLLKNISEIARIFYLKDTILEYIYTSVSESEKLAASQIEITQMQSQNQLIFIDLKGVDFSKSEKLSLARSEFGLPLLGNFEVAGGGEESGEQQSFTVTNRLTYTILYKELNSSLRGSCLSDVQEYVFARLLSSYDYDEAYFLASNTTTGISYLELTEVLYKNYKEINEVFKVDESFSRYGYFKGNAYFARISNESDLIGYYVGDNTPASSFTNGYGYFDYQKFEIQNFLEIYKETRDYYYRVLLNKSFIHDDSYSLFEKMFIGWVAIERFISSKISNLKNPDLFNSEDIFNFLESYGLGVLNSFSFFLGSKDFKINIIKNFNKLIKLKGSKDVINLLGTIFDTGDTVVDINKFLLVDDVEATYDEKPTKIGFLNGEITFFNGTNQVSTKIKVYDPTRIYYVSDSFKLSNNSNVTLDPSLSDGDLFFDDESYKLYSWNSTTSKLVEEKLLIVDNENFLPNIDLSKVASGTYLLREVTIPTSEEHFVFKRWFSNTLTSATIRSFISVVSTLPVSLIDRDLFLRRNGTIVQLQGTENFYEKIKDGWQRLKVNLKYPSVILNNAGKNVTAPSIIEELELYNNQFYYIEDATGVKNLNKYLSFSNRLVKEENVLVRPSFPKLPNLIDVPVSRFLIKSNLISREQLNNKFPMMYKIEGDDSSKNNIFIDVNSMISNNFNHNSSALTNILIKVEKLIESEQLRFVEVPYPQTGALRPVTSNETREILNTIDGSTKYEDFLEKNEFEKIDPYWTKENVPEETLRGIGIDSVETKYLSLTISENIYRRYTISRYILSAIEFLEERFKVSESSLSSISRIKVDVGSELLEPISIYELYQTIKVLFKTLLKLYSVAALDQSIPKFRQSNSKFFGINKNVNWTRVNDLIGSIIPEFKNVLSPDRLSFIKDSYRENITVTEYDKFNLYNKIPFGDNPILNEISYDGEKYFRKDQIVDGIKSLNKIAEILRYKSFATHKFDTNIGQENSGEYVLELFENLNTIRIQDGNDLWNYYLSRYSETELASTFVQNQINEGTPDKDQLYNKIIESMVKFPIDVVDGLLNSSFIRENVNLNKEFIQLCNGLLREVYLVTGTEKLAKPRQFFGNETPTSTRPGDVWLRYDISGPGPFLVIRNETNTNWNVINSFLVKTTLVGLNIGEYYVDEEEDEVFYKIYEDPALFIKDEEEISLVTRTYLEEAFGILDGTFTLPITDEGLNSLIEEYSEKLFSFVSGLESIFSAQEFMQIKFSLKENEERTLGFIETAIKIFLSYTAQLYSSSFKRQYDTISESPTISETINFTAETKRSDYVFYDEKLDIRKEEE